MAKKKSAGFKSYEEAAEAKETQTKAIASARAELKAFIKDNGLKKSKDYTKDKKHGKAFKKLNDAVEKAEAARKEAMAYMKENKPKKERKERVTKYDYSSVLNDGMSAEEIKVAKKNYRSSIRGKANSAGVSVEEYLTNPEKYAKASSKKEKAPAKSKKASTKKEAPAKSKKAPAKKKPAKKKKED